MLPPLLIRDETICSLGKTDDTFTVHHVGETTSLYGLICQRAEIVFHPETSVLFLNSFHFSVDRKKSP
jgi:hypothetical protein